MPLPRPGRRIALVGGVAAALTFSLLPLVDAEPLDSLGTTVDETFAPQLVTVTADLAQRNVVANSGLDVTEHAGHDYVEVVLHSAADLTLLESLGLPYEVRIPDLFQRGAEIQAANEAFAASNPSTALPSSRNEYRTLEQYNADMIRLAETYDFVRLLELPHPSVEGKTILGIEIASGIDADDSADDERPTFLLMGLHHAREWPSGEHAMELAYDLIRGKKGTLSAEDNARIRPLVDNARTVVIPVVNPDGFEKSINDGMALDLRETNEFDDTGLVSLATPNNAYKRKNCRTVDGADGVPLLCDLAKSPIGYGIGVDLNRNYGAFHGGPGASAEPPDPTYHGPEGFSEPETQNVRELVSARHVTMLISNHTFSNLVLRPNGVNPQTIGPDGLPIGDAPDEDAMKAIGADMAAQNGYANIHGWQLYDTTGTTEDWSYNATGGFGYTFEIGENEFHPPFQEVIDEYVGVGEFEGQGNREAFLIALEAALDPATHSIVAGQATPGTKLRLSRTGSTPTWEGSFEDSVDTQLTVPASGWFEWHTNPSTRPLAMSKRYDVLADEPTERFEETGAVPAPNEHVDVLWEPKASATLANVALDWQLPDDLDLEVYRVDTFDADGAPKEMTQVGSSGNFVVDKELATFSDVEPGTYVIRVINFASVPGQPFTVTAESYSATSETTRGLIETWTLTCEDADGNVLEQVPVVVDRGQRVVADLDVCGVDEPNGKGPMPPKGKGKR